MNAFAFATLSNQDKPLTPLEFDQLDYTEINGFDRSAVFNNSESASILSDVVLYSSVLTPFLTYFDKKTTKEGWSITVMALETYAYNIAMTHLIKSAIPRFRPYTYNQNLTLEERSSGRTRESFYSGHTSTVAAATFFTSKVLSDIHPNMKNEWLLWSLSF